MAENPKICNYTDMQLRRSSNRILRSIKRSADSERYLDELLKIRRIMLEVSSRTTLLVVFPGETKETFTELTSFTESDQLKWLGALPYYRGEGTPAFD